ncbi:hypothetical protein PAL_GLEAN10024814 [Pteropus alecto]|uniref:Uncharacterized protein n=1 Tax=Pteropus alecto TaxID=9402 RepID=L5JZG4_PTEAL|nr:hypothetical protein PAL_GLEAN10024814 [Pteropus alecto]
MSKLMTDLTGNRGWAGLQAALSASVRGDRNSTTGPAPPPPDLQVALRWDLASLAKSSAAHHRHGGSRAHTSRSTARVAVEGVAGACAIAGFSAGAEKGALCRVQV